MGTKTVDTSSIGMVVESRPEPSDDLPDKQQPNARRIVLVSLNLQVPQVI